MLAGKLKKKELPCYESLVDELKSIKIDNAHLAVVEMDSITDFSTLIKPHLNLMSGHTQFFQFRITKANRSERDSSSVTVMTVKKNSLEERWDSIDGVKLLKSTPNYGELVVAPFREDSSYREILNSVTKKYFPTLASKFPVTEVEKIEKNWVKRIKKLLQSEPTDFKPFDFNSLKPQAPRKENETVIENIHRSASSRLSALTATFYPNEMNSFSAEDLKEGDSVVFYTAVKRSRPWVGLFLGMSEDEEGVSLVEVQWLRRERKQFFLDLNEDGSQFLSKLELETIMFTNVTNNLSPTGERSGPYEMDTDTIKEIKQAYSERDSILS